LRQGNFRGLGLCAVKNAAAAVAVAVAVAIIAAVTVATIIPFAWIVVVRGLYNRKLKTKKRRCARGHETQLQGGNNRRELVYIHSYQSWWFYYRVGQSRTHLPYMTVYLVISLPNIPYIHRICIFPANPKHLTSHLILAILLSLRSNWLFGA